MTNQTPSASGPENKPGQPQDNPPRAQVLQEAERLITGDRNVSYGSPTENFKNIGDLWSVRFGHKLKDGEAFTATDVADAMILLKVARNIAQRKRDGYVDIAGYAGCGYEAMLEEDKEAEPERAINVTSPHEPELGYSAIRDYLNQEMNRAAHRPPDLRY